MAWFPGWLPLCCIYWIHEPEDMKSQGLYRFCTDCFDFYNLDITLAPHHKCSVWGKLNHVKMVHYFWFILTFWHLSETEFIPWPPVVPYIKTFTYPQKYLIATPCIQMKLWTCCTLYEIQYSMLSSCKPLLVVCWVVWLRLPASIDAPEDLIQTKLGFVRLSFLPV